MYLLNRQQVCICVWEKKEKGSARKKEEERVYFPTTDSLPKYPPSESPMCVAGNQAPEPPRVYT